MTQVFPELPEGVEPPTPEQLAEYAIARDIQNAYIAEKERLESERLAELAKPITPLPITGSTVSSVKASADASVKDLAIQMQAKLDLLGGTSG